MSVTCCDKEERTRLVSGAENVNGLEFVEIDYAQNQLIAKFFRQVGSPELLQFALYDTTSSAKTTLTMVRACPSGERISFYIDVDQQIEGRRYVLSVTSIVGDFVPTGFDPRFSEIEFTFNANVGSETDFVAAEEAQESSFPPPSINYLAKDYASFKQLILDRMAITMPAWQETHAADLGMTLVELLAFVADRISYEQDAIATEAYLGTSRKRTSVRRHARLVDYRMHEGCNSRAFLHLTAQGDSYFDPSDLLFTPELPRYLRLPAGALSYNQIPDEAWSSILAFEPIAAPLGDWRIKPEQIKDKQVLARRFATLQARLKSSSAKTLKHQAQNIDMSETVAQPEGLMDRIAGSFQLPNITLDRLCEVNAWLESVDLFNEAEIYGLLDEPLIRKVWHLPIPDRNRAIIDDILQAEISSAPLTSRIGLYEAHNEILFYTWDESECWLPKGATKATLSDCTVEAARPRDCSPSDRVKTERKLKNLKVGDWLLFEEVRGPRTYEEADANRTHRHFVRLTKVSFEKDPIHGDEKPIVEIEWDQEDALPFPLCLSSKLPPPECEVKSNISVARGNIVIVDHGRTIDRSELHTVTGDSRPMDCGSKWHPPATQVTIDPFRPQISDTDVTFSQPLMPALSAKRVLQQDTTLAVPAISLLAIPSADGQNPIRISPDLLESNNGRALANTLRNLRPEERYVLEDLLQSDEAYELSKLILQQDAVAADKQKRTLERLRQLLNRIRDELSWTPRFDLLSSGPQDRHFAVETDETRRATLRFGDGEHGQKLEIGTQFHATYRVGSGSRGNVGAEVIRRVIIRRNTAAGIVSVRNPMPAQGGTDPETLQQAKLLAPHAYRKNQPRALVADDYRALVEAKFAQDVQSARANKAAGGTFDWIDVAVDPFTSVRNTESLIKQVQEYLDSVRKIGHRVRVTLQRKVAVDLRMTVTLDTRYPLQPARQAIMQRLSNQTLPDGTPGFFHPDRLTFGQSVHSNELIKEVLRVPGVKDAQVTFLGRMQDAIPALAPSEWQEFQLTIDPMEIAQLDNSGSKDGGRLCLTLEGGR